MQFGDLPVCPPHISKFVYYSAIWTMQCAYISMMHEYVFTTLLLVGASGTVAVADADVNTDTDPVVGTIF